MFRCVRCGGSLEVEFDYPKLRRHFRQQDMGKRPFGCMKFMELYPVKSPLTAGEGGTPLIRSRNAEKRLGLKFRLWFKLEYQNPTGSFKDRGSSVEIAKALEFMEAGMQKKRQAVCASTGNMGASVAAYSGIADIGCSIFVPHDASILKLEQIMAHGAKVYRIRGDYTRAAQLVETACRDYGLYLLGDYLYRREGTKSLGFELAEQLAADYVFLPVGNGTLLSATWKAFREMKALGFSKNTPKMAGIQASGCNPVYRAFSNKTEVREVRNPHTVAVAMECGDPLDGDRALRSAMESGGFMEQVTDSQILGAREFLARNEGIFAEPGGAAAFAGIVKSSHVIARGSDVVCVVTGHGLKSPHTGVKGRPIQMGGTGRALERLFG